MKINAETLSEPLQIPKEFIDNLQRELSDAKCKLNVQAAELIAYKERYERLIEDIRLMRQQRFSSSSEKNILQASLFDELGAELSSVVQAELTDEIEVKSYLRKKHPVRCPLPLDIPREIVVHDIPEIQKVCGCGACLVKIGEEVTEQLKYIPPTLSVLRHVRYKYACKPCQGNVKVAPMPILLLPKSIATPELVAYTIVAKYVDHCPLYRQEAMWKRLGIDLSRSSLCGWALKTAELCEPLIQLSKNEILSGGYVQADETTVQVLDEAGRHDKTKSYMWVYRGGDLEHPSLVFEYQETRGGYHAQTFLKDYKGYLQTDAYSGYLWTEKVSDIIWLNCMAHARRPFAELVKLSKTKGVAYEALIFFQKFYAIEKTAREESLSYEARNLLRHEKATPILNAFKEWLDYQKPKVPEQNKLGTAISYCLRHWTELINYLKDGRLEIDNNNAENAIRPFALGRKNWLFAGSPSGAKAAATLYSLTQTCKANNIEPYRYFCAMLNRIRFCKTEEDYKKLLPQFIEL